MHDHDDPENATRLAATVKSTLKSALSEMWQAEVRLRTHRPREALPYERRALDLLKRVQQAARSYVLRTGFDPPPIDRPLRGRGPRRVSALRPVSRLGPGVSGLAA